MFVPVDVGVPCAKNLIDVVLLVMFIEPVENLIPLIVGVSISIDLGVITFPIGIST